jgi:uncharacterized protein YqgC (DUF456 family)
LIVLGALLVLIGIAGCIVPVVPGPPLSFAGLLLLWGAHGWEADAFGLPTVIGLGVATVVVTILDYVTPVVGARKYGASKAGVWGSVIGMVVGLFGLLPVGPLGMLVGAFVGAWVGEVLVGKEGTAALKAAWGVFIGTVVGVVLKLVVSVVLAVYFVAELL